MPLTNAQVIRNLSMWTFSLQEELSSGRSYKYAGMWANYAKSLIKAVQESENLDFLVETLGTLANITSLDLSPELSWSKLISKYSLLQYFHKLLVPGFSQDDVVLEVINCIANIVGNPDCVPLISSSQLIQILHNQLQRKNVLKLVWSLGAAAVQAAPKAAASLDWSSMSASALKRKTVKDLQDYLTAQVPVRIHRDTGSRSNHSLTAFSFCVCE